MRTLVKQIIAGLLYYSGLLSVWETARQHRHATILAYHCFLEQGDRLRGYLQPGLCISPDHFDQQLAFFKKKYNLLSLDEYLSKLDAGEPIPRRSLVITVDDGWRDNYDQAYPLLKRHETPAAIFLTTDYIDSNRQFWFYRVARMLKHTDLAADQVEVALQPFLANATGAESDRNLTDSDGRVDRDKLLELLKELDSDKQLAVIEALEKLTGPGMTDIPETERATLTWDEVREMHRGGVTFGSHGQSHRIMTLLTLESAAAELTESARKLETELGQRTRHFAYPNGDYSPELAEAVRQAGYVSALATGRGLNPDAEGLSRFALRRIGMHDGVSLGIGGRFSQAMLAFHLARLG